MENKLENDFCNIVQENQEIDNQNSMYEWMDENSCPYDEGWNPKTHDEDSIDLLVDDEEYYIQKENVDSSCYESGSDIDSVYDGMDENSFPYDEGWNPKTHDEDSIDLLVDDEEYYIQKENVDSSCYESGSDIDSVYDGMDENSFPYDEGWNPKTHDEDSIDLLVDDEEYYIQKENVDSSCYESGSDIDSVYDGMDENSRPYNDGWNSKTHE